MHVLFRPTATAALAAALLLSGCDDDDDGGIFGFGGDGSCAGALAAVFLLADNGDTEEDPAEAVSLTRIGRVTGSGAEISSYDPQTKRLFVVSGGTTIEVWDLADPTTPTKIDDLDVSSYGSGLNSVKVLERDGANAIAVAVQRDGDDASIYNSGFGSGMAKVPLTLAHPEPAPADANGDGYADNRYFLLTDRGPNISLETAAGSGKIFPTPDFTPRIGEFEVQGSDLVLLRTIDLKNSSGEVITGLPNPGDTATGEIAWDLDNQVLTPDGDGIDSEGLVALPDGSGFWVSDEYGPWIRRYNASGSEVTRLKPSATTPGLPLVYLTRRANRGMEGLTHVPASANLFGLGKEWLVGVMQSPMQNPARRTTVGSLAIDTNRDSQLCRLLCYPTDGTTPKELVYVAEAPNRSNSEIRWVGDTRFVVLERDGTFGSEAGSTKKLYLIDLAGATDIHDAANGANGRRFSLDLDGDGTEDSVTLEQLMTPANLARVSVTPVAKSEWLDLLASADYEHDKPEGFEILDFSAKQVAIINDDDFGIDSKADPNGDDSGVFVAKELPVSKNIDRPTLWIVSGPVTGPRLENVVETKARYLPEAVRGLDAVNTEDDENRHFPGFCAFYDTATLAFIARVFVGALPDMVNVTPDGDYVLVANEGEPNEGYTIDPEGSVSIIDVRGPLAEISEAQVHTAGFAAFEGNLHPSVRIFGPGATVAQDLEPEFIAIAPDSRTAWVSLQENNAVAVIDIASHSVTAVVPLGFKDHSQAGNELDASNRDGGANIRNWPVFGMYQPDMIEAFDHQDTTYIVTANEGDARDYEGFSEEDRVKDLTLGAGFTPGIQADDQLGRLKITTTLGENAANQYDSLFCYGGRSFSVWSASGQLLWDSGRQVADITLAENGADGFNADPDDIVDGRVVYEADNRSDDKGAEPEAITVGMVAGGRFAFIGLERTGGILVYQLNDPLNPVFVTYLNDDRLVDAEPEGLVFIPEGRSPTGDALLIVTSEGSDSTTIYRIDPAELPPESVLAPEAVD